MVLDEVIQDALSKRINNEMNTQEGPGQEKEMWQARGGKSQSGTLQTAQRIQLRIGNRLAKHFVQWLRLKRTTA